MVTGTQFSSGSTPIFAVINQKELDMTIATTDPVNIKEFDTNYPVSILITNNESYQNLLIHSTALNILKQNVLHILNI